MWASGAYRLSRKPNAWVCLAWCLLLPIVLSAAAAKHISWPLAIAFIALLLVAPVSRPSARNEADDHLMVLAPAFTAVLLFLIKEKWANGSESLPWLAAIFAVIATFQFLSLSYIAALLRALMKCIVGIVEEEERGKAEAVWKGLLNEKERFWNRLLGSKTMALWPVFAAITAAILGLPDWMPKWQGDRSILVVTTGALAFYGQRRGAYEQAQLEIRIRALVEATELAERDCEAERRKRDGIARDQENSERDREIERRKQKDLLAALNDETPEVDVPSGNLSQLELFFSNSATRLNAVNRIVLNAPNIVRDAARKLFEIEPTLIQPGGNAYTHRRMAACLRDMDFILRYITCATFIGDSSILYDRCINGLRETYLALGVPTSSMAESLRIMKDLVTATAIDPKGVSLIETVQQDDYVRVENEIAAYFDLVIDALL
jgi:phycocyanin beta chain